MAHKGHSVSFFHVRYNGTPVQKRSLLITFFRSDEYEMCIFAYVISPDPKIWRCTVWYYKLNSIARGWWSLLFYEQGLTVSCCCHCFSGSSQRESQLRRASQHSSPLCWWRSQKPPCNFSSDPPATRGRPPTWCESRSQCGIMGCGFCLWHSRHFQGGRIERIVQLFLERQCSLGLRYHKTDVLYVSEMACCCTTAKRTIEGPLGGSIILRKCVPVFLVCSLYEFDYWNGNSVL